MNKQTVRIAANQTMSLTLSDVTNLLFSISSGLTYCFEFYIIYKISSGIGSNGVTIGLTSPSFSILSATARIPNTGDSTGAALDGWITSSGDYVSSSNTPTIGTNYLSTVKGTIKSSTSGSLQVQMAKVNALSILIVQANSGGTLQQVA